MPGKKQFPLRLDPMLYEALERWAADEFRSVNAHIEYLLRGALLRAGRLPHRTPIRRNDESGRADVVRDRPVSDREDAGS